MLYEIYASHLSVSCSAYAYTLLFIIAVNYLLLSLVQYKM